MKVGPYLENRMALVSGVLSYKPDWPLRKKVKIENDHKNMIDISNESTLNYIYDIILRYG